MYKQTCMHTCVHVYIHVYICTQACLLVGLAVEGPVKRVLLSLCVAMNDHKAAARVDRVKAPLLKAQLVPASTPTHIYTQM